MKLILLPGNSKENKVWIEEIEATFKNIFDSTKIQYYEHWNKKEENLIDLGLELENLVDMVGENKDYIIFAKSAGVLLALRGIYEKVICPRKCLFVGTPVFWSRNKKFDVDLWLKNYSLPTLFIQKTNDPMISYIELMKVLEGRDVENYKIVEVAGNDHHYENVQELKTLTVDFL